MEVEVFSLCDGAFNYSGKLTIVGTYDQLNVQSVPFSARASIAVKLNLDENEIHSGSVLSISFKDPSGNPVSADVVNTIGPLADGIQIRHVAMAASANLNISLPGKHSVELFVDGRLIRQKFFDVVVSA